ncbi:ly6/PLAUR domain-containing protein 8-like [Ochotona princeps]|uniref:ly6/PLAUR domain-containing protein 8-like n=1 Tax=Ochotona princeps TaxID=9978 RepID=UPI002714EE76|nr:ly6/PLAUR domain-containing protein 8-like [Ochotona princeps]
MRSILVFGLLAALTVVAVESLECPQCINILSDCNDTAPTPCPVDSQSCGVTVARWPGDFSQMDQFCSAEPPGSSLNFAVRATNQELFLFANENCREKETCTPTLSADFPKVGKSNTECPTCSALNGDSCEVRNEICGEGERCVDLRAQFSVRSTIEATVNSVISSQLEIKGCSNISDAACIQLSEGNVVVGNITFQHLMCTPEPTMTPDSNTTSNSRGTGMGTNLDMTSALFKEPSG